MIYSLLEFMKTHSLMLLLLAGTVFTFIWLMRFREKLKLKWYLAILLAVMHTMYGVLCVKFFAVFETADLNSAGNMSLFGAVFLMPLGYLLAAKLLRQKIADVFDICTICLIFTLMCARFNCIISGCCKGISFFGISGLRWPTRELEIIFYIVLLAVFGRKVSRGEPHGVIYPMYMMSYGAFRFLIEWFRVYSGNSVIHRGHIWALISLCLGCSIYAEMQVKQKKGGKKKHG